MSDYKKFKKKLQIELKKFNNDDYDIKKSSKLWAIDADYWADVPDMASAMLDYDDIDIDDVTNEIADNAVDVYHSGLLDWLGKDGNIYFVNQATDELGHSDTGIMGDIAQGQYIYYIGVLNAIREVIQ